MPLKANKILINITILIITMVVSCSFLIKYVLKDATHVDISKDIIKHYTTTS